MSEFDPAWRTQEDAESLWFERALNASVVIGAIAFGIHMVVFSICTYQFVNAKRFQWLKMLYIGGLFVFAGITIGANIHFNQLAWIDYRNYPGGQLAFLHEMQAAMINTLGNSAGLIVAFMADSLLIYRCYVVWGNNYYVIILPTLMLVASTVMSVLQTWAASQPGSSLWAAAAVRFGLPYFVLTMTVNMLVTSIIITRLLIARRQIHTVMGKQYGSMYTSVAAMLVESALPLGLVSLVLVTLYALGNTGQVLFFPVLPQVQAITPQLIFIRVNRGHAWTGQTMSNTPATQSGMKFKTRRLKDSGYSDRSGSSGYPPTKTSKGQSTTVFLESTLEVNRAEGT